MDNNLNSEVIVEETVSDKKGMAIAIMILGIASIVCCPTACMDIIIAAIAIILFIVGKDKIAEEHKKKAKIGLICAIVGVVLAIIAFIAWTSSSFLAGIIAPMLTMYTGY